MATPEATAYGLPIISVIGDSFCVPYPVELIVNARHRRTVHRGESSESSDLLFSVQRSHSLQLKTKLEVFLAGNTNEDVENFQVVGTHSSLSYKVYKGDAVIAEADHNFAWGKICKGKDDFRIKVNPGVDYGLIVALLVILAENDIV